jgi:uncharacterized protein (TIGR02147 family)
MQNRFFEESLSVSESDERDISSLTLGISQTTYHQIKQEIHDFRNRLRAMASRDRDPNMVAHVEVQLMPYANMNEKEDENAQEIS